ncbi:kinase-like protein [Biscogniauxia marginata]|nr:kinase-like protein [Biscogniauxia marginata]
MPALRSDIRRLRRASVSRRWFVPELPFQALMTETAICSALVDSSVPSYQREEIAKKVFQHGIKVFGILVLVDCVDLVSKFIEMRQLKDAMLPFRKELLIGDIQLPEADANDFQERQWEFIAPTFTRGTLHRRFEEYIILPFTQEVRIGGGAFGVVYETTLDPVHQELGEVFPEKFISDSARVALNHQKELHPNIVELLGSYTWNGCHNLLFPLADTGNLAQFLDAESRPTRFELDETIVIALAAVSSAVHHVHDFCEHKIDLDLIGCHHDLRPRNILVSGASFILADFGLSTFKPTSQSSGTPFKHGADDYLGPECVDPNNNFKAGTVRRSSDVWSLGCIIAEGTEDFLQARKYRAGAWEVHYFHKGPRKPNEGVEKWLSQLEASFPGSTCALLDVRPKAREVTFRLRLIALHNIAIDADLLFRKIRDADDSLDMFLEHTRLMSWRYAIGILGLGEEVAPFTNSICEGMSKFDALLACLKRLRDDLKSRHSRLSKVQYPELSRILQANDELHDILSQEQKEKYREYFHIHVMGEKDELFDRIENGHTHIAPDKEIRMRANIKHINALLANDVGSDSRTMQTEPSAVKIQGSYGENSALGWFNSGQEKRPVWVEWRRYGKHGADERTLETLHRRTARIAEVLSQEKPELFRTLKCTGFFHEPAKAAFGVVFEIPLLEEDATNSLEPRSLQKLIAETADKYSSWPDLDDRFRLASTLAASLLELHTVGWFHKSLTTSNVIFFPKADVKQGQRLIHEPFLVGFNHSRPDDPLAFTSGISDAASRQYQHPKYIREGHGFQPEFDYYSVGVVLLEIGCWQPLEKLTKHYTGSYEDRRRKLLRDRVPQLKVHMGRDYCEAVRCCIESDFGDTEPGERSEGALKSVLLQFGERVVARLRKNFVV